MTWQKIASFHFNSFVSPLSTLSVSSKNPDNHSLFLVQNSQSCRFNSLVCDFFPLFLLTTLYSYHWNFLKPGRTFYYSENVVIKQHYKIERPKKKKEKTRTQDMQKGTRSIIKRTQSSFISNIHFSFAFASHF